MSAEISYPDAEGRVHQAAGGGWLRGRPLSSEVSEIRKGENPHPHSLAEAIQIAGRKEKGR